MRIEPYISAVEFNGIRCVVKLYPTTDRASIPVEHRADAELTDCGNALLVVEPAPVKTRPIREAISRT